MKQIRRTPFAKRSLGQNFLVDPEYIRKIVAAVDPRSQDTIVEIGPGRGALTKVLVESGAKVIAIELDRDLGSMLKAHFRDREFELFEADVLDFDFRSLSTSTTSSPDLKLVANLPYNISTAILQRLAAQRELFSEMVLMFQKEVVDRITAEPGNAERGFLTVIVEVAFRVEKLFEVPPNAFAPRPKIWSAVVRFIPKSGEQLNNEAFADLVGKAFAQKRKTLLNNLKASYTNADQAIERSGIDPTRRAETLTIEEWSNLYSSLAQS